MNTMGAGRSDDEIDALLAQGRFPGPTRDRVFEGALRDAGIAGPDAPRAPSRWRLRFAVTGLSLAAGVAALVLVPRLTRQDDSFRAKGAGGGVDLDVTCVGPAASSLAACPQGATLVFSIRGAPPSGGYLAGYAEPRSGGERIWYFAADGGAPALAVAAAGGATAPVSRAIRIGPEHAPGDYRIALFVTTVPVGKAALLAGPPAGELVATRAITLRVVAAAPQGGP